MYLMKIIINVFLYVLEQTWLMYGQQLILAKINKSTSWSGVLIVKFKYLWHDISKYCINSLDAAVNYEKLKGLVQKAKNKNDNMENSWEEAKVGMVIDIGEGGSNDIRSKHLNMQRSCEDIFSNSDSYSY